MDVRDLLKHHEAYKRFVYRCPAGYLTAGYGRNLETRGLSEEEADYLLANDVLEAISHLRGEPYWLDLNDARQAVLIDMVVNLGWGGFSEFKKLRAALTAGDYPKAAAEMANSRWYGQVGNRSKRLVGMMQHGVWPAKLWP